MSALENFDSLFRLDGKVALITGGSRGLGLHTATAFLRAGAHKVIITARKAEGLNHAVEQLNALPGIAGSAVGIPGNAAQVEGIKALLEEVRKTEDHLDILVANAGTTWGGPFETTPDWAVGKVLDLNVRGIFNLVQLSLPLLTQSSTPTSPSRIILVSSVAGTTVPHTGPNGTIIYSASKAAVHHLARNLAIELGPRHITTNTVAPGFLPSKLANGLIKELGGHDKLEKANPRGRLGLPEDVAGVMLFLCSRAGAYVNGEDIAVDGGARWTMGRMSNL